MRARLTAVLLALFVVASGVGAAAGVGGVAWDSDPAPNIQNEFSVTKAVHDMDWGASMEDARKFENDAGDGLLDGATALVLGVVAIVLTIGTQAVDLIAGLADFAAQSPLVAGQLATIGVGVLGALGRLSVTGVVVGGVALLLFAIVWRRRE